MTGTISFSGLGSGMDIDALVNGLVNASSGQRDNANQKVSQAQAAITSLSGVSSLLKELKTVVDSLDTATELSAFKATSTNDAVAVTATGSAASASYRVRVGQLAKEQRTYSSGQSQQDQALNKTGTLRFTQGGQDFDITVEATDSLADISAKINESDAAISSSLFFDGTEYRMQLRSDETGADAAFTIEQRDGLSLGLDGPNFQDAQDSSVFIDGFEVTSASNTISGAIQGVTLELKDEEASEFQVKIQSDSSGMKTSLQDFVTKYNNVVGRIHSLSGFGGSTGTSEELRGDSTLRMVTNRMSSLVLSQAGTGSSLETLADLGVRFNNDGTLKLDSTKLDKALASNPESFRQVLAGTDTKDGMMDLMSDLLKGFTDIGTGTLDGRTEALRSKVKLYQSAAAREQVRLDAMELRLRKTLGVMDASVSASNSQMNYLYSALG